jgi:single-strand DNA-binding protein
LQTRKWQDKESGQDRYITEVTASEMIMLDGRKDMTPTESFDPDEQPEEGASSAPPTRRDALTPPARAIIGKGHGASRAPAAPARSMPGRGAVPDEDLPF